ncbi:hypothetical protein SNEBB_006337 [Seison nebaliae]|nr:hypothetical protein SNEBB_006337 [Seison nebaliae]
MWRCPKKQIGNTNVISARNVRNTETIKNIFDPIELDEDIIGKIMERIDVPLSKRSCLSINNEEDEFFDDISQETCHIDIKPILPNNTVKHDEMNLFKNSLNICNVGHVNDYFQRLTNKQPVSGMKFIHVLDKTINTTPKSNQHAALRQMYDIDQMYEKRTEIPPNGINKFVDLFKHKLERYTKHENSHRNRKKKLIKINNFSSHLKDNMNPELT